MTIIDSQDYLGHEITLHPDEDPESPREWENLTTLVLGHRRYTFPNEAGVDFDEFASWSEVADHLRNEHDPVFLRPVYLYDHGALAFRVGHDFGDIDPGGWDSGIVGIVMVTREQQDACGTPDERLEEAVKGEVETYETYVNGYVVGYTIHGPHCDESCWGYYTWEDAYADARAAIDHDVQAHLRRLAADTAQTLAPVL